LLRRDASFIRPFTETISRFSKETRRTRSSILRLAQDRL